ncbi:hypothetical protein SKAU_G00203460 [Synaphobranchus kaupii]|uniref:DUF4590 domain-containing protein n=1 Tax=Synaphobranchus kaupii TaxID=118154 RepID=A0A9Q1FFX8_SYNKA|nr:hypothetical protein SKAU_G00203460 [Synaphobranchus kaupii]
MSHLNSGFVSAYNSLTDKHLVGFFNNTRIRRHLHRAGLITKSGSIVPEKEYRQKLMRRDHQRYIRECLTQAIFHKVLDIERQHRTEIKRKLEDFARKERVHKIKFQRSKKHNEGIVPSICPRPPSEPRNEHTRHSGPEGEQSESSESPGSSRPSSAPGKRQRPVRLRPLYSKSTTASTQRASHCCRRDSSDDAEPYLHGTLNRETRRHVTMPEFCSGISPYRLPVINNYVTPMPPPAKRKERSSRGSTNGRTRGRSLRPTTAPNVPALTKQDSRFHRTTVHSNVSVTMTFYGKAVHLTPDTVDARDEVKVFQQHCGGENVCVYRGKLAEGEAFQFVSRRHMGFPFSLTFFLNGMLVERLSSCCEFRHRGGSRLGGKRGQFGFTVVDGASPCYRCIIALGLDKKPTPPPKRLQMDTDSAGIAGSYLQMARATRKAKAEEAVQPAQSRPGLKSSQGQTEQHAMDTEAQEDQPEESKQKAQDDYEEDFEEEDERADDVAEGAGACVVVNGASSFPFDEGRDSRSESKKDKAGDHRESEDTAKGSYSDREVEEEKAEEKKKSASVCSGSGSLFSGSRKEDPESEAEEVKEGIKDNGVDPYSRSTYPAELRRKGQTGHDHKTSQGGDITTPAHREKPKEEEYLGVGADGKAEDQPNGRSHPTSMTELDSKRHGIDGCDASETSLEESDSSMPSKEKEAINRVDSVAAPVESAKWSVAKPEADTGETETQRGKSVQEKLTAAVTKEAHFSSELETSDSSSDEDDLPTTDTDRTPELDPTGAGVEAVVAEKRNAEETATSSDEALNISTVHLAPRDGNVRTLEMGEKQELEQGAEEEHPDVEEEKGPLEDGDLQAKDPMEKGEGSEEEAQVTGNSNTGTDSQTNPADTVKAGATAGEGDWTDEVAEDTGGLTDGPGLTVQVVEEGKVKENETERWLKEGTESIASNEAAALILEKEDMKGEDTGEEEGTVEKVEEMEPLVDAKVTLAGITAEHCDVCNAEEEREAEQETTDTVNGETEMTDGGKDNAEGENKEETETTVETPKDEVEGEERVEAQTGTGDIESKMDKRDDTNKEKLSQAMEGEENDKTDQLVNTGVNDDKDEVVGTMRADTGENEASSGQSEPAAEEGDNRNESDPKTEVWQAKCDKMEDSEAADITVEEPEKISLTTNPTEKEDTERVSESSVGEKGEGLEGENKAVLMVEESEEMSAKEEEAVRDTETKAEGLETEIKEEEMEVRDAEMGSTGEEIEETPVGEEPKSEIEEEQTVDQEMEGKSQPNDTDMTPATEQDTKTPGKVETGPMKVDDPDEPELLNKETGGLEMKKEEANIASDSTEKDAETDSEVPGDGIDVVKGDADMKEEEEELKVRAAVESEAETKAEENKVNIDPKGVPDESPSNSKLQAETRVVKSDVTGAGLKLKAEDESGDQDKQLEEFEEPNKEGPGVDADVTECDVEGSEGKSEDSWLNTDHRRPPSQEEGSSNNAEIGKEGSETANNEGLGVSHQPGSAALEVESIAAQTKADEVEGEERRKMGEEEETAGKKEGQDAEALGNTARAEKTRVGPERPLSRSKTEPIGRNGVKFPPPLIRSSGSYTLMIAREGLSLQKFAASDPETENPLAYAQTAAAITGNAFTASNQKLQSIGTKDM